MSWQCLVEVLIEQESCALNLIQIEFKMKVLVEGANKRSFQYVSINIPEFPRVIMMYQKLINI